MTKAKMPVAKHHTSRVVKARAGQVWTEELTFIEANADYVDPSGCDPYAPSGRRSRGVT
ncbi:hypothetical protein N8388_00175 [Octadecabacter sp.]|nr:hypothetical protein [bacterium]MDC1380011.1 hypothetical protein [Octadecabacter sp.]MDC1499663.1 hypothetical protein [Octadecabacter sp.]